MAIHLSYFNLHRLFTCILAHPLLKRFTNLKTKKIVNLRAHVLGNIVSLVSCSRNQKLPTNWAAALEFVL